MVNSWTFDGNVGSDPELRTTQSGQKVLSFRVANAVGFGEKRRPQWVDVSYWGKGAEGVAPYLKKGMKITCVGELTLEEFNRKDGTPGSKLAVRLNDLGLPGRSEGSSGGSDRDYVKKEFQDDPAGGYGGGGGKDYGNESRGGSGGRSGGKPAFDKDLEDEIPFVSL